jgi:anti-sigma factor ChrR (cupin superfamily)
MAEENEEDRQAGSAPHPDAESLEAAALHALGALSPEEARGFEAHRAGCASCAREEAAFREVLAETARAFAEEPPANLKARLLARLSSGPAEPQETQVWKRWAPPPEAGGLRLVRSGEGSWEPTAAPGVSVKRLSVDPGRRSVTMLVRMEPGSSYPRHRHAGAEECYVLQGDLKAGEDVLHAGDFQRAEAGSLHGIQSTEGGCLLLIVSSQDDELIDS